MSKPKLVTVFVNTKHKEKADKILKERGLSHGDFINLSYESLLKLEGQEKVLRKVSKKKRKEIEKRAIEGKKNIDKALKKAEKATKGVKYDKKLAKKVLKANREEAKEAEKK